MVKLFEDDRLGYKVGRDFEAVAVSINPNEGPEIATAKKKEYLNLLSQPGAGQGWHFLTGSDASIHMLAAQVGYRYVFDAKTEQYAHPAGLILLTPGGKVSKYFYGVEYSPIDLRLAMTDAGQGKVGSLADKFVLYCYHYDPARNSYGLAIFHIIQVAGTLTVLCLGTFMFFAFRDDIRNDRAAMRGIGRPSPHAAGTPPTRGSAGKA
jgi:protein SCO1/2